MTQQYAWDGDGIGQGGGALDQVKAIVEQYVNGHRAALESIGLDYDGMIMKEDELTAQIVAQLGPAVDSIEQILALLAQALGVPGFNLGGVNAGQGITEESNVSTAQWTGGTGKH